MTETRQEQLSLFGETSPASEWDKDAARRALDELFSVAGKYRTSKEYFELLRFVARFRSYSPFNAMLAHLQMPGAIYVAPAKRWFKDYGRRIKPEGRPLVILQPMGPVMFVFDVSDTEPAVKNPPPLPREIDKPFEPHGGTIEKEYDRTVENAVRDGVRISEQQAGSQRAGQIGYAQTRATLCFPSSPGPSPTYAPVPLRYELLLNSRHSREAKYATLAHELAHLYCGHLGSPNVKWWPDRRGLDSAAEELEAESVSYLVCKRLGIDSPSEQYLAGYVADNDGEVPGISLDRIMKAAGLIEQMGVRRLKPRMRS